MDPDSALAEIRKIIAADEDRSITNHNRLIELIAGLDGWLTRGGFLPAAWVPEMGREAKQPEIDIAVPPWTGGAVS